MSRTAGSFVKQAAILAIAGLFVRFIGFLYRLPLTNMIGDEGNGIYGTSYMIYIFLLTLSASALPAAVSKMVSERIALGQHRNAHRVFKVSLNIGVAIGLTCAVIMGVFAEKMANSLNSPQSYYAILTLAPTLFIVSFLAVFRGYFQGMKTMVPTAISQIVEQIFNASASLLLAYFLVKKSVPLGAAGATAGTGIGAISALLFLIFLYFIIRPTLHKKMRKEPSNTLKETSSDITQAFLKTAAPIIIGTSIGSLAGLIDMVMIKNGLLAAGYNSVSADRIYGIYTGKFILLSTLPVAFATAIGTAVVPNIASSFVLKDIKAVNEKINTGLRITFIISLPAAAGLGVLGTPIIEMLFPSFREGGNLLEIGAVSVVFLSVASFCTGALQGLGLARVAAFSTIIGLTVKIILNSILISDPRINIIGAVISTIVCYLISSVLNVIMIYKKTKISMRFFATGFKALVCAGIMGIICYDIYHVLVMLGGSNTIATISSILIGVIVYFFLMLISGGIMESDIKMLPKGNLIAKIFKRYLRRA